MHASGGGKRREFALQPRAQTSQSTQSIDCTDCATSRCGLLGEALGFSEERRAVVSCQIVDTVVLNCVLAVWVVVSRSGASPRLAVWFVVPVLTGGCLDLILAERARALGFELRQTSPCGTHFHPAARASRLAFSGASHSKAGPNTSRTGASPRVGSEANIAMSCALRPGCLDLGTTNEH